MSILDTADIEIRPLRGGRWQVSGLRPTATLDGLRQALSDDRDGARKVAMRWLGEYWRAGLVVEVREYDERRELSLSMRGLRDAEDLRARVAWLRAVRGRAMAAATAAGAPP